MISQIRYQTAAAGGIRLGAESTLTTAAKTGRVQLICSGVFDAVGVARSGAGQPRRASGLADPAVRAFDARVAGLVASLIGDLRGAIAAYVADVIAGWELNARFEAEIGSDLQYMRINGAVLGSMIGGLVGLNALLG